MADFKVTGNPEFAQLFPAAAIDFLVELQRRFDPQRRSLLKQRQRRQRHMDLNKSYPAFPHDTAHVRQSDWQVAPCPPDLSRRHVEITGPADAKMTINALNSGADVFMADFEDSLSPTWQNIAEGQLALRKAVRRVLQYTSPEGKEYKLKEKLATLVVRPRGLHMVENHVQIDGVPMSASLLDFGLYFFHNYQALAARRTGPYFYLPKLEGHKEARWWAQVFNFAEDFVGVGRGTICATVLIENVLAAFEMEEILYELKEHSPALNAGRWDYLFSIISKFRSFEKFLLPDRAQLTMDTPFMDAYCRHLVKTCHKRGAHALGGMAAFIPNRRDPAVTEAALAKVRADKEREVRIGFDGTWVAHPELVPVAAAVFSEALGDKPNQKDKLPEERVFSADLCRFHVDNAAITHDGLRLNVSVAIQYIGHWLNGSGAVAINNLMEDAATAEISRSQLWQWIYHGGVLSDGRPISKSMYKQLRKEELRKLVERGVPNAEQAARLLDKLVLRKQFTNFLTKPGYELLTSKGDAASRRA